MQKYKKAALSIAFLTLLLSGGLTMGYTEVDAREDNENIINAERRILTSFENNDYEEWKKILSKKNKIYSMVAENDFKNFVDARKFVRKGDYDKAIELSEKLEMDLKNKLSKSFG